MDRFLKNAAIPALNRQGIKPVGVFHSQPEDGEEDHSIHALIPYPTLESYYDMRRTLSEDSGLVENGHLHFRPSYLRCSENDCYFCLHTVTFYGRESGRVGVMFQTSL